MAEYGTNKREEVQYSKILNYGNVQQWGNLTRDLLKTGPSWEQPQVLQISFSFIFRGKPFEIRMFSIDATIPELTNSLLQQQQQNLHDSSS